MIKTKIEIKPKESRFKTKLDWLESYHSFSFGPHYDPANIQFGLLRVHNDDIIKPASGFGFHHHNDMEIVTWVLSGELEHKDSAGNHGIIYPGLAQRMSAGSGIQHSEINPSPKKEVRLLQMWVLPDSEGISPSYEQKDISAELNKGGLIPLASGQGHDAALKINQKGAVMWVGRLKANDTALIPDGPFIHLYVAEGDIDLEDAGQLTEGDAARLSKAGARKITSGPQGAHVVIWVTQLS